MLEKVYCVHNYWDMTILEGVADFKNKKYHFKCIFSEKDDDWTDVYELKLLDDNIFKLLLENWEYWKKWLKQTFMPHPVEYAKNRKTKTVEEIFFGKNIEKISIEETEKYYQNEIIIQEYLKSKSSILKAKCVFFGKINGMDTNVEWTNVEKIT